MELHFDLAAQTVFGLPAIPGGNSGSLTLNRVNIVAALGRFLHELRSNLVTIYRRCAQVGVYVTSVIRAQLRSKIQRYYELIGWVKKITCRCLNFLCLGWLMQQLLWLAG